MFSSHFNIQYFDNRKAVERNFEKPVKYYHISRYLRKPKSFVIDLFFCCNSKINNYSDFRLEIFPNIYKSIF